MSDKFSSYTRTSFIRTSEIRAPASTGHRKEAIFYDPSEISVTVLETATYIILLKSEKLCDTASVGIRISIDDLETLDMDTSP